MNCIVSDIDSYENQIHQFFYNQEIGRLLKHSNIDNEKGIPPAPCMVLAVGRPAIFMAVLIRLFSLAAASSSRRWSRKER